MTPSRTRFALSVILAVAVLGAAGCARKTQTSGTGLEEAKRVASQVTAAGNATGTPAVKVVDSSGSSSAGSDGTAATTGGTGDSSAPAPTSPDKTAVVKPGMKVRIIFWNDTSSKPLKGTEIVIGSTAFKPDTLEKSDRGTLGPAPYGDVVMITVYPDGRDGKKIQVPLTVTKAMVPNSEQDAIHVAVSDGSVRVLGNAISNLDQIVPRF